MDVRRAPSVLAAALTAVLMFPAVGLLSGCSQTADGDAKMEKVAADANAIADKSGGDWSRLNADERSKMLGIAHGNERAAKELLYGLAGKTHEGEWGTPEHPLGGPPGMARPAGGPPAGGPPTAGAK